MIIHRPGRISWERGLELQLAARDRVLAGGDDELILCEHDPVVTLGRRGGDFDASRLAELHTPIVQSDRGGLATWHGPGQAVGYPIIDLERRKLGVPALIRLLGAVMLEVAADLGVDSALYDPDRPGIYVRGRKLGSIGLHIHHHVSHHGFALNVGCDLAGFQAITPCGFADLEVTTIARETGASVTVGDALTLLAEHPDLA